MRLRIEVVVIDDDSLVLGIDYPILSVALGYMLFLVSAVQLDSNENLGCIEVVADRIGLNYLLEDSYWLEHILGIPADTLSCTHNHSHSSVDLVRPYCLSNFSKVRQSCISIKSEPDNTS